jgi:general secretion pathway protein E
MSVESFESESARTAVMSSSPAYLCGRPLGEILRHTAHLSPEQVEQALAAQVEKGGRIGERLVELKFVTEVQVLKALAVQLDLPYTDTVRIEEADPALVGLLPIAFARQGCVLPLSHEGDHVLVVVADPLDTSLLDRVRMFVNAPISVRIAPPKVIEEAINQAYDRAATRSMSMEGLEEGGDAESMAEVQEEMPDLIDTREGDEAPIIKLVNYLIFRAAKDRASDIHVEPMDRYMSVRFRRDGVLDEVVRPPKRFQKAIASRIKLMGGLNIAETRLPQDGRIRVKIAGKDIDIRLSTVPTSHGERLVMRLLDKSAVALDMKEIGFNDDQLEIMHGLIDKSHGIVLVTGPTGSGKTTTLYAALSKINKPDINILTVEDPVEYQLNGIGQVAVNAKIELTFANALRSFLRQDPDVIMVGEIRDRETAEIAIQASLTGHLVFATVHTNDAPGALTRLVEMGVEPFLVASSLVGVLAQRLVRVLCKSCKQAYLPTAVEMDELNITPEKMERLGVTHLYRPVGCADCNRNGFRGRTGIYELMLIEDSIRQMILAKKDSNTIKTAAIARGMLTLMDDGARKVMLGITTSAEVLRVTQEDG